MEWTSCKIRYRVPGLSDWFVLSGSWDLGNADSRTHLKFLVERLDGTLTAETQVPISLDGETDE